MTLKILLELKNGSIVGALSLFKTKLMKDDSIQQNDIDFVKQLIDKVKDGKSLTTNEKDVLFKLGYTGSLTEAFDMISSLKNSIIAWEVALKKTNDSGKVTKLRSRIATAKKKLAQIDTNSK